MTSLASWCTGDAWFNDFPVDEAVPMVFQMGADSEKIKTFLRNGNDWPRNQMWFKQDRGSGPSVNGLVRQKKLGPFRTIRASPR